jgi:glycerol uptake facilitator-like aquaporin
MFGRRKVARLVAEFMGTTVLAMVLLSVSRSAVGLPYFVAIAVGMANALLVLTIGAVSGAQVNPIVTLGLWTLRKISAFEAIAFIAVQFAGGLTAWRLYTYLINDTLPNIAGKNFDWRIVIAEAVGALVFTFGVAATVYRQQSEGVKAATVGMSLIFGLLIASAGGNAVLNPALAVSIQSWSVAYVIGPIVGSIIGMNLYSLLFADKAALAGAPVVAETSVAKPKTKRKTTKK